MKGGWTKRLRRSLAGALVLASFAAPSFAAVDPDDATAPGAPVGAARLCPADPAGLSALRDLCGCAAITTAVQRLQCFDQITAQTSAPPTGDYQTVNFTDLLADGDRLRHQRIRIGGMIYLTPTSVYLARSPLEIASAVPVDIADIPSTVRRVLYETCPKTCQAVVTGTLEGAGTRPAIKADNVLPPQSLPGQARP